MGLKYEHMMSRKYGKRLHKVGAHETSKYVLLNDAEMRQLISEASEVMNDSNSRH